MLAALLVAMAIGLVHLRTGTMQAGNRLHSLYNRKRALEKACLNLELAVARTKNQEWLRQQAQDIKKQDEVAAKAELEARKAVQVVGSRRPGAPRERLPVPPDRNMPAPP